MRRSELRTDAAKTKAWQSRSRSAALKRKSHPVGPLSPAEWREAVWHACGGRCVATGVSVALHGPSYEWAGHHPIPKQHLPLQWKYDPRNGMVLLAAHHDAHEARTAVIPFEKLPASCMEFAQEMDALNMVAGSAVERLLRCHPHKRNT